MNWTTNLKCVEPASSLAELLIDIEIELRVTGSNSKTGIKLYHESKLHNEFKWNINKGFALNK